MKDKDKKVGATKSTKSGIPESLVYPASEDKYNKAHKESEINPE